ncbi:MAG: hypothetical protein IIB57_10455 [Planctomycetes bacterium]|nr:hypothetical protein [Planctomycetota bacterium]
MQRVFFPTIVVVLVGCSAALAECTCGIAKVENGWCGDCKVGYVAGVKIKSDALFESLLGHEVDEAKIKCPSCKKAHDAGGLCESCKTGFVEGKAYHSWVGYRLASGKFKHTADIKCPGCRKAAEGAGWCDGCAVGYVAHRKYTDRKDHEQAVHAQKVLRLATASKCETCAIAMVSDGECAQCKVKFTNGEKSKTTSGG